MRIGIGGLVIGWILTWILTLVMSVFLAWSLVTIIAVIVQIKFIHNQLDLTKNNSIGFWMMIGAHIPVYYWVLGDLLTTL